jgi:hypothetical protein
MAVITVRMMRQRDDRRRRLGLGEDHSFVSLWLALHLAALVSVAHYTPVMSVPLQAPHPLMVTMIEAPAPPKVEVVPQPKPNRLLKNQVL